MTSTEQPIPFDIKDYRQSLITAMGFKLGFLISFLGQWSTETGFSLDTPSSSTIFWGCLFGASSMIVALFMLLIPSKYPSADAQKYRRILVIYGAGTISSIGSIMVSGFLP